MAFVGGAVLQFLFIPHFYLGWFLFLFSRPAEIPVVGYFKESSHRLAAETPCDKYMGTDELDGVALRWGQWQRCGEFRVLGKEEEEKKSKRSGDIGDS